MAKRTFRSVAGLLFLFTVVGGVIGLVMNSASEVVFESRAVLQITPNLLVGGGVADKTIDDLIEMCDRPHAQLIGSRENIGRCLVKNHLYPIDSLLGLSHDQCVDLIKNNLEVKHLTEQGIVLQTTLRSNHPQDSATILNNLIKHYVDELAAEYPKLKDHYRVRLLEFARTGEQVLPNITSSLAKGLCGGAIFAAMLWLVLSLLNVNRPRFSLKTIVVFILMPCAFAIVGAAVSTLVKKPQYVSTARIQISDNASELARVDNPKDKRLIELASEEHDVLLSQYLFVGRAAEDDALYQLKSLQPLAKEDGLEYIQKNLRVVVDDNKPNELELFFCCEHPEESQLVLNSLIKNYFASIEARNLELQAKRNLAENGESEFCIPKSYETTVVQPATKGQRVGFSIDFHSISTRLIAFGSALLGFLVCWIWYAAKDSPDRGSGPPSALDRAE